MRSESREFGTEKGRGWFGRGKRRDQAGARRDQRRRAALEALEVRSLLATLPSPIAGVQGTISNTNSETSNESTPSIAVDPTNPLRMVATWTRHETNVSNPPLIRVEGAYSIDGGLTWQSFSPSGSLSNPNTTNPTVNYTRVDESSVGFDRNGNVYILTRHHTSETSGALALSKFTFTGTSPTVVFRDRIVYQWTPSSDQAIHPMLAVDDTVANFVDPDSGLIQSNLYTGNVYVGFATVDVAPAGNPQGNQFNPNRIKIMGSSDGGLTFSGQTVVNDGGNNGNQRNVRPRLAVLQGTPTPLGGTATVAGGTVAVVWDDFGTLATASPARDILRSDRVTATVSAAASATAGGIADNAVTNFPINVNITDPRFISVSDVQVRLAITHAAMTELRVELVPPVGSGLPTITLFNNQTNTGNGISGANLGILNGFNVGTLFDDSAARRIVDIDPGTGNRGAAAPYIGLFRPEAGSLAGYNGATAALINGTWTLRVTDVAANNAGTLNQATITFTSGLAASNDTNIATTFVRGSTSDTYSRATAATAKGLGPGLTLASDRTLGSFSPFQGRLYAAYTQRANTDGNPTDNTDIYLVTSDDAGLTWSAPTLVTDDFARVNGFSEGEIVFGQGTSGRPQFQPNVAVDQTTGTVALSWFDTRYDAARARVTTQVTTSIDGGRTFSEDIYANRSKTALDAITFETVVLGPIPDNQSAANPNTEATFNYGNRQGLAFAAGRIIPVWAGNLNGGANGLTRLDILTNVLTTSAGPRVYSSTMGPIGLTDQFGNVVDPINSGRDTDGTPILTGFDIIFDRPIDPTTFRPEDIQVFFRDTTLGNVSGGPVPVVDVFPQTSATTDPDYLYNPGNVLGYTRFRVQVAARTAVGTYSYAISPTINDRIRNATTGALGNLADQDGDANPGENAVNGVGLGDVYAAPRPTSTGASFQIDPSGQNFFAGPYDPHTLPLVLTGPRVIASQVPGSLDSGEDIALNQPVNRLDITFDRDVMASSFNGNDVLRLTGPNGELIQPRTYAATITTGGLAIPDNNTVNPLRSTITVTDDGAFHAGDINVSVNITHPRVRDLILALIAPDGTRVELANAVGGPSGANFNGTTFDDEATTSITAANAPFTGVFRPSSPLSAFDGKELRGNWTLEVTDTVAGQTGTLTAWSFAATPQPQVAPVFNADLGPTGGMAIPDGGMIEALLNIAPNHSFTIADLNAAFDIEHARPTDLKIELIGPDGTTITLLDHIGGPLERNILGLTLDDQATLSVTRAAAPFTGIYQPQGPGLLAAYNGQELSGTWRLRITDLAGNGGGTLRNFSLVASPSNPSVSARAYRVTFPTQNVPGTYAVALGPDILDRNGNAMDADADAGVDLLRGTALNAPTVSVNYNSADVPRTLVDGSSTTPSVSTSVLTVPDSFLIADLNVTLNISHTKTPDLTAVLIAPDGTRIILFSGVGNVGTQHGFVNTTLDDQATTPIQNGARPFFGTFNPQQPLGILNGRNAAGTWTLEITDNAAGGTGTLTGWNLTFARPVPNSGLGEPVADRSSLSFRVFTMDPTNPLSGNVWTPVGPASANDSGAAVSGYAGRVSAIAVDPSDPTGNTVYIGAAAGGVWKSTNFLTTDPNGPTWVPLTDFGPTFGLHISSIAIVPRNNDPNQSILFVTTGEAAAGYGWGSTSSSTAQGSTVRGVGFLRSSDGGATWTLLDSTDNTLPFASRNHRFAANGGTAGFRVVADPTPLPTGEYIVYAALAGPAGGFWRSLDTGDTWQKMSNDGTHGTRATDIILDDNSASVSTGNIDRIFVAFEGRGVYFSPNRGQRLDLMDAGSGARTEIRDIETGGTPRIGVDNAPSPNGGFGRITLAKPALVPSSDPNAAVKNLLYQNWLYAAVATPGGSFEGLYLTKDRGATWTKLRLPNEITNNGSVARPSNDPGNPDYNVSPSLANYNLSLIIDPTDPAIVYVGGTSIFRESGLIRVDASLVRDPYSFVFFENDRPTAGVTGGVRTYDSNPEAPARVKRVADGAGNIIDPNTGFPIRQDFTNLIQFPYAPFLVGSTIYVNNTAAFSNDGTGVTWTPFDAPLYSKPSDLAPSTNVQHAVAIRDPLTGEVRLIFGTDQGVFTGLDRDGQLSAGVGTAAAVNFSRSGNLQTAHMFQGAAQPSTTASQIAGAVFYGTNQATGYPSSRPDVLTTGNTQWVGDTNGELDASDVATDQQGLGTVYQYKWPSFGGNTTEFFQVNGIARTRGLIQTSNDPQWPSTSPVYGGLIAMGRFAVNPLNGDQVVISSNAGRIFGTTNQARDWTVIGNPGDLDGTYAPALAYGAPDPNGPGGVGNLGNFIYAGTLGGRIFVTQTGGGGGGNAWQSISTGLDGSAVIGIAPSPDRGSHAAYAVTLNGVYYTPDSLSSPWQNITGNLFSITQKAFGNADQITNKLSFLTSVKADWRYAIPEDFDTPGSPTHPILYVSGSSGVYRSIDNGGTWTLFPASVDNAPIDGGYLPSVAVTDLDMALGRIDPTNGRPIIDSTSTNVLLASTFGRGAFAIRLAPQVFAESLRFGAGSDSGASNSDLITNVTRPVIEGLSAQTAFGAVVSINLIDLTDPANPRIVGTGTTDAAGRFSIQIDPGAFASDGSNDGLITIGVQATDQAGTKGNIALFRYTLDTLAPDAPGIPDLQTLSDSPMPGQPGYIAGVTDIDNITNIIPPRFNISSLEPAETVVSLLRNDQANPVGQATSGSAITDGVAFPQDGVYQYRATQIDLAGNVSLPSDPLSVTIDTTAPAQPAAPTLLPADNTGDPTDTITSVRRPRLIGGGVEPGALVQLIDAAGNVLGETTAASNGSYTVQPSADLGNGSVSLRIRVVDVAGNISIPSNPLVLTIAAIAPAAPTLSMVRADDTGSSSTDNITHIVRPRFEGRGTPGLTVELLDVTTGLGSAVSLGTAIVAPDGSWLIRPNQDLPNGPGSTQPRLIQARIRDAAGNTSLSTQNPLSPTPVPLSVTIDTVAPTGVPTLLLRPQDDTGIPGDNITVRRRPVFIGTGEPGALIDLFNADRPNDPALSSGVIAPNGAFALQLAADLNNGTIRLQARIRDAAGNVGSPSQTLTVTIVSVAGDFDNDGKTDPTVYRPSTATWAIAQSTAGTSLRSFGGVNTIPLQGDFDGDGKADVAIYAFQYPPVFFINRSTAGPLAQPFGSPSAIPAVADFDGDGRTDIAIYEPSNATWYILQSTAGPRVEVFGVPTGVIGKAGDIPIPADYDGDGKADLAVWRPNVTRGTATEFRVRYSGGGTLTQPFGAPTWLPVSGDYDGDGKADLALFDRPSATWFVIPSATNVPYFRQSGAANDVPVPGDYDGDGKSDLVTYRPATGRYHGTLTGGSSINVLPISPQIGDIPLQAPYTFKVARQPGAPGGPPATVTTRSATPAAPAVKAASSSQAPAATGQTRVVDPTATATVIGGNTVQQALARFRKTLKR